MNTTVNSIRILGLNLYCGSLKKGIEVALKGGLVVAPAAPGLAIDFVRDSAYREALLNSDLILTDSGYLVLLWRIIAGQSVPRHSGLKFIRGILELSELCGPGSSFWVMPSEDDNRRNQLWLSRRGIPVGPAETYVAPLYDRGPIFDQMLLDNLEARRPRIVVVCLGGGVQERLGYFLRKQLSYRPTILCIGAAIAFLTGGQVAIPVWADRLMLGWFFRICSSPTAYFPRYWRAKGLVRLVWKYRDRLPPLKTRR